jgi:ribosomal protein L11 methyltransferase
MNSAAAWLEASVQVSRQQADQVEDLMLGEGALAVTLTGECGTPWLEPAAGETPKWQQIMVTGLFPVTTRTAPLAALLSQVPGVDRVANVMLRKLADQDWERAWMKDFKPMRFGRDLWIVPSGYAPPESAGPAVRLDPGLAFGTGVHPTTRLCLQWIDAETFGDLLVVDYGCGSGVLGIATALKGARRVVCVDHDPQALLATRENASRNGVSAQVETLSPASFPPLQADIVMANILAATLEDLAPILCTALRPGGKMILSGILAEQAGSVAAAYAGHIADIRENHLEGWVALTGARKD